MSDRLEERIPVPTQFGGAVESAAEALTELTRFSLKLAALPAWAFPRALRGSISEALHSSVKMSAVLPHAVLRGVNQFADELSARGDETDNSGAPEEADCG